MLVSSEPVFNITRLALAGQPDRGTRRAS
jgi:hypothetical protein